MHVPPKHRQCSEHHENGSVQQGHDTSVTGSVSNQCPGECDAHQQRGSGQNRRRPVEPTWDAQRGNPEDDGGDQDTSRDQPFRCVVCRAHWKRPNESRLGCGTVLWLSQTQFYPQNDGRPTWGAGQGPRGTETRPRRALDFASTRSLCDLWPAPSERIEPPLHAWCSDVAAGGTRCIAESIRCTPSLFGGCSASSESTREPDRAAWAF
jgi:hypothetical protein